MANLLYLMHGIPYPPDKGDKLRSFHLLQHLARRHRVFVSVINDPADEAHVPALGAMCASRHLAPVRRPRPASAKGAPLAVA